MTYSMRSKGEQFDYMLPRQIGDRSIILGGSKPTYLLDKDTWYNNWDDSTEIINEESKQYFEDFMLNYFENWGIDHSRCKEMWTGIFGRTSDLMPFVGELPDQTNGYVIAGFNGHGMSRILLCARALIDLVLARVTKIEGLIPEPFLITKARLEA
jgi:glycine/D-amino acid oxidase-like deaminating enzyme